MSEKELMDLDFEKVIVNTNKSIEKTTKEEVKFSILKKVLISACIFSELWRISVSKPLKKEGK